MKRWLYILTFCMASAMVVSAIAAESDKMTQFDEALKAVAAFEYGKDAGPLDRVERMVVESAKDAGLRGAVEQRILRALGSGGTRDGKGFLCRQLRTIGTARCVPQLEQMLTDPELSHMARYALGSIEEPAAAAALHRAMGRTSGKIQVGIINTLADRRYRQAQSDLISLLGSPDSAVAEASARALGRIGGTEAVKALEAGSRGASKTLRQSIDNALLLCAEQFLADGRPADADRIYEKFYSPNQPIHLRLAGLRGLAASRGAKAAPLLVEAIRGTDSELRRSAISLMTMVQGQDVTNAFVALLPSLPAEGQQLVLGALGSRGDPAAARAVSAAIKSDNEAVRVAALEALGSVGDASAVVLLSYAAATGGQREKQAARASLLRLRGDDVDPTLIRSVGSGDANMRVEFIRALAGRGVTQASGKLLDAARDDDQSVRHEAIRALGSLTGKADLGKLAVLAVRPRDAKDRPVIEQAVAAAFRRIGDKDHQAQVLLDALADAPVDAKPTILRLLGRPATRKALDGVRAALKDTNAEVADAAVRTLADWPDATPAEELLAIARTYTDRTGKVLALRGYIRMAGMSKDPTAMYVRAMELAESADDKKLVLSGLGAADSAGALELVERYLKDGALQTEAGLAAVQIADRLRQKDATLAKQTLKNVVSTVKDQGVRQKAQDVINEMEQYDGHILVWLVAGPYTEKDKRSRAVFNAAFPPEKPDAGDVQWAPLTKGVGSWDINLDSTFGSKGSVAAYMRTRIWSSAEQDARLELGSDDAVKAWLNGRLVHEKYTSRGLAPRQDLVNVKLRSGWNDLLVKVMNQEGGWGFCCRVRKPDGSALDGLKVEAK